MSNRKHKSDLLPITIVLIIMGVLVYFFLPKLVAWQYSQVDFSSKHAQTTPTE